MEAKWSRTTIPVPASGLGAHTLQLGDDKRETLDKGRESLRKLTTDDLLIELISAIPNGRRDIHNWNPS